MTEVHLDSAYDSTVEARFHGSVTDQFSWVANFNATLDAPTLASPGAVGVMDLAAQFKAADELQIWAGRVLVPSDRSNFSGPFFMLPWNYPGFYIPGAAPLGPKDGPTGRDQGVTVWGNAVGDKLKYYGGVYGIDQGALTSTVPAGQPPYLSGRISYSLQGTEPGYFGSSSYYGAKNVVTVAVAAQFQSGGSIQPGTGSATAPPATQDTVILMADALAEENVEHAGTFTFEGQFYRFNDGYAFASIPAPSGTGTVPIFAPREAFYVLAAYTTPMTIGWGRIQPLVRLQQTLDPAWTIFDAALAYVIEDSSARVVLTYEHIDRGSSSDAPDPIQNSLQLGVQVQTL